MFGVNSAKSYCMAVRDEGMLVFAVAKHSKKARLLYDFGMRVGDKVRCDMESYVRK